MPVPVPVPPFAALAVAVISFWIGTASGDLMQEFRESGLATWYSVLQLLLTAGVVWTVWRARRPPGDRREQLRSPALIWALMAAGFFFLAIDDRLKVHENLDSVIHRLLGIEQTPVTDHFDDAIVGVYGLIGLWALWRYRRELARFRGALPLAAAGFACFWMMVSADFLESATSLPSAAVGAAEESFKVLGGGFFLAAGLRCRQIALGADLTRRARAA